MDLEVKKERGKFYVIDRESGQKLNKGKPFTNRALAVKFMERKMGADKLAEGGDQLMPKMPPMPEAPMMGGAPDMAALMGGGMPPLPGVPGPMPMPGKMDALRMKPKGY